MYNTRVILQKAVLELTKITETYTFSIKLVKSIKIVSVIVLKLRRQDVYTV